MKRRVMLLDFSNWKDEAATALVGLNAEKSAVFGPCFSKENVVANISEKAVSRNSQLSIGKR